MGNWFVVVREEDDTYAGTGLFGSIVEASDVPGKYLSPAGWAGIRERGSLTPGLIARAPRNREERRAVEVTRTSSDACARSGRAMLDGQYLAAKGGK